MDDKLSVFQDRDGFTYKFPERSCELCLRYPCIDELNHLLCDFAKYGCLDYYDFNMCANELEAKRNVKRSRSRGR